MLFVFVFTDKNMERFLGPTEILCDASLGGIPRVVIHVTHLNTKHPISEDMISKAAVLLAEIQPFLKLTVNRASADNSGVGSKFIKSTEERNYVIVEKRLETERSKWRDIVHAELNRATYVQCNEHWKIIYVEYSSCEVTETQNSEDSVSSVKTGEKIEFIPGTLIMKFDYSIADTPCLFDLVQNQFVEIIHDLKLGEEETQFKIESLVLPPVERIFPSKYKRIYKDWTSRCKELERSNTKQVKHVTYSPIYEEIPFNDSSNPRYIISKRKTREKPLLCYLPEVYSHKLSDPDDMLEDTKIRTVPFAANLTKQILESSKARGVSVNCVLLTACAFALGKVFRKGGQAPPKTFSAMFPIDMRKMLRQPRPYSVGNWTTMGFVNIDLPRSAGSPVKDFWNEVNSVSQRIRDYMDKENDLNLMCEVAETLKNGNTEVLRQKLGVHFELDYLGFCDKKAQNPIEQVLQDITDPFSAKHYFFKSFSLDSVTSLRHGFIVFDGNILMSISHMERWLPSGLIQEYIRVIQTDLYLMVYYYE